MLISLGIWQRVLQLSREILTNSAGILVMFLKRGYASLNILEKSFVYIDS